MHSTTILHTLLFIIGHAFAIFNDTSKSNLAIYWGQNSINTLDNSAQKSLKEYCNDPDVDIILIAFVSAVNTAENHVELNLANQLFATNPPQYPLPSPETGVGITECQKQGKTVLLSLGGDRTPLETGFTSEDKAKAGATTIWNMFGPPSSTGTSRPFGSAVVNGFDLDFEVENAALEKMFFPAFIKELRRLIDAATPDTSPGMKKFWLTAAPECAPKNGVHSMVQFDMWFVQFYNNGQCDVSSTSPDTGFTQWETWAAGNKTKFLVGLPASTTAASSTSFISTTAALSDFLGKAQGHPSMIGAMLWDASQSWANDMYHKKVNNALAGK